MTFTRLRFITDWFTKTGVIASKNKIMPLNIHMYTHFDDF